MDNTWFFLATDGTIIATDTFKQQPSVVVNNRFTIQDEEDKYQLFSLTPRPALVTTKQFIQIGYFFEKVTLAQDEKDAPLLLVNQSGEIIHRLEHYNGQKILMAHNFKEGLALIYTANQKYGYINTQGEMVIKPLYDIAYDFSEGLAVVGLANEQGQWTYQVINKKGEIQFHLNLQHCRINSSFSNGLLMYKNLDQNYCAFLNPIGKTVLYLPNRIAEAGNFKHEAAIFLADDRIGLLNKSGKILIPANYEEGKIVGPDRIALKLRGKWALFDFKGKAFCEFTYDWISEFQNNGCAFARQNQMYVCINDKGQWVTSNKFSALITDDIATHQFPQVFTRYTPEKELPEENMVENKSPDPGRNLQQTVPLLTDKENPFYLEAQKVLAGKLPEVDAANRKVILNYMEYFRSAYITKDLQFLEQLFSEDALIVVGKVVKKAPDKGPRYLSSEQVIYNLKSKREYLNRLKAIFKANKQIRVEFKDFNIKKHPTLKGIYGVSVKQAYTSDLYSDKGYLFLLWDFRDKTAPQIHVRTWQPSMLDENTPLPEQEIFSIRNFNLE